MSIKKYVDIPLRMIKDPVERFYYITKLGLNYYLSDEDFIKIAFRLRIGYEIDLNNPKTFNEKLQWLKLHDRKPIYTTMVDKYEAKKYVAGIIGEKYIIPTLGVWEKFNDIDFQKLPEKFVLKCTHDSGGLVICKDKSKFDVKYAKRIINMSLHRNYYMACREWPYKNVKPRIIAEKYMEDSKTKELRDYKFMCFNGNMRTVFVCSDRFSKDGLKVTFFDRNWNRLPFIRHYSSSRNRIEKPEHFEDMVELAEKLSEGMAFVRVDFYEIEGRVYFGELTLYPGSGFEEFSPLEWDYKLGSWLNLNEGDCR